MELPLEKLVPPAFAEEWPGYYPVAAIYAIESVGEDGEMHLHVYRNSSTGVWRQIGMAQMLIDDLRGVSESSTRGFWTPDEET